MPTKSRFLTSEDEFYSIYGRCINEWVFIEHQYFDLFCFALGTTREKAALIFYEWQFSTQIKMTNKLMKIVLRRTAYRKHKDRWFNLSKSVDLLRPFRNELAHEPIQHYVKLLAALGDKKKITAKEKNKLGLGPYSQIYRTPDKTFAGRSVKLANKYDAIKIKELKAHFAETRKFRKEIRIFMEKFDSSIQKRYRRIRQYTESRQARK